MSKGEISFTVFRGSESGDIVPSTTKHGPLQGDEVLVNITASGLCGTDLHYKNADAGHEGVGLVKEVGPSVKHLKVGDRVGWGYIHDTCGECQQCLQGTETFCPNRHMYGEAELDQGSLAQAAVWREAFLFTVPEAISDVDAAPLMCGGATVFNALRMYDIQPTAKVGIIGVGGLGHLAIQFASKMGCDTVVFSGTDSKKDEATKLGAHSFYATKGVKELNIGPRGLDALLVTTSAKTDWDLYLPIIAPGAKIFPLSVAEGDLTFPYMPFLVNGLTLQASIVAPRHLHREMLEFAALHGIRPIVNEFSLDKEGIEKAIKRLEEGQMRYRGVLVPAK